MAAPWVFSVCGRFLPEVETTSANGRFFRFSFYFDYTFAINHFGIEHFMEDQT